MKDNILQKVHRVKCNIRCKPFGKNCDTTGTIT